MRSNIGAVAEVLSLGLGRLCGLERGAPRPSNGATGAEVGAWRLHCLLETAAAIARCMIVSAHAFGRLRLATTHKVLLEVYTVGCVWSLYCEHNHKKMKKNRTARA